MIKTAIELARSIVNLEVFDVSDYHKKEEGTVDICTFFGEKIMRFAEEYKEETTRELLTDFMIWFNENKSESMEKDHPDVIKEYIDKYCDRKSSDEITI